MTALKPATMALPLKLAQIIIQMVKPPKLKQAGRIRLMKKSNLAIPIQPAIMALLRKPVRTMITKLPFQMGKPVPRSKLYSLVIQQVLATKIVKITL